MPGLSLSGSQRSLIVSAAEFLRDPSMIGSPFPASDKLVDKMLAPIDWAQVNTFVEFGPGTGQFTRAALERLKSDATLLAIETGKHFVDHLRSTIFDDRLLVAHGPAVAIDHLLKQYQLGKADCILSGLPMSTLGAEEANGIIDASCSGLRPTGLFAAYQMRRAIEPLLRQRFAEVTTDFEWWNIPPCHLYWASQPKVMRVLRWLRPS